MKKFILVLTFLVLVPGSVLATTMALDFNDDSAEVRADFVINRDDYSTALLGGRFLYNDDEESEMISIELKFLGDPGSVPGLEVGAGFIGYIGESYDVYDFSNVGVGLMADYSPGTLQGLGFSGRLVYSPEIFSWQDSDGLFEYNLRVNYAITPKVKVYVGYQSIESEIDGSSNDVDIDDDVRVGLRVQF
jgi:hypothetical protein